MMIKKNLLFAFFLMISTITFSQTFPDGKLKTLDGRTVQISDYIGNGTPTIVNFWATWCTPCKQEMNAISELYEGWLEDYGVRMVSISIDDSRTKAKVPSLVSSNGWEFDILLDTNRDMMNALSFQTVPQTYLLDGEGNIIQHHSTYTTGDEYGLEEEIRSLVEGE